MKEKLRILIQNENLTASKLAEILEIKPAGISHILSGRNNPSFELICKIVNKFSQVNPYWLLGDAENMYNVAPSNTKVADLSSESLGLFGKGNVDSEKRVQVQDVQDARNRTLESSTTVHPVSMENLGFSSEVERVIVIYKDKSFESFNPRR